MHLIVGDIHGCFDPLIKLLKKAGFDEKKDKLWLTGDLVNRGPQSAAVLRYLMNLGDSVNCVLGNHDLHLLAVAAGVSKVKSNDTIDNVLEANDAEQMLDWLGSRPLAAYNTRHDFLMVHAGIHKSWSTAKTLKLSKEVENVLQSRQKIKFLKNMYGNQPDNWDNGLTKWDRLRLVTNVLTRSRYYHRDGRIDLSEKGPPGSQNMPVTPWFELKDRISINEQIFFGHWSSLGFYQGHNVIGMDGGYLWGGKLTAVRLNKAGMNIFQVKA